MQSISCRTEESCVRKGPRRVASPWPAREAVWIWSLPRAPSPPRGRVPLSLLLCASVLLRSKDAQNPLAPASNLAVAADRVPAPYIGVLVPASPGWIWPAAAFFHLHPYCAEKPDSSRRQHGHRGAEARRDSRQQLTNPVPGEGDDCCCGRSRRGCEDRFAGARKPQLL